MLRPYTLPGRRALSWGAGRVFNAEATISRLPVFQPQIVLYRDIDSFLRPDLHDLRGLDAVCGTNEHFGYSWIALFYTGCLLVALASSPGRQANLLSNRMLMGMGTIAYCSYLIHMPVIQTFRHVLAHLNCRPGVSFVCGGLLGVGTTVLIAMISWKFLEKPLLRRGRVYTY